MHAASYATLADLFFVVAQLLLIIDSLTMDITAIRLALNIILKLNANRITNI